MGSPAQGDSAEEDPIAGSSLIRGPAIGSLCPITLPKPHGSVSYRPGVNIEAWSTQAEAPLKEYARDILYVLYDAGFNLVEAGYLDLFGNNWGCVAYNETIGVLTLTVKVARNTTVGPSSPSSPSSPGTLEVLIVRTLPQELTL